MTTTTKDGWIVTASDVQFELFSPAPVMVRIVDIAHALANLCRFNGHTQDFYSVAQHSVIVSRNVPDHLALAALLHDASEAYLGDMVRPLKRSMPAYREAEANVERVIEEAFGLALTDEDRAIIKFADERALMTERRDLLRPSSHRWNLIDRNAKPFIDEIEPQGPREARAAFLDRFARLMSAAAKQ